MLGLMEPSLWSVVGVLSQVADTCLHSKVLQRPGSSEIQAKNLALGLSSSCGWGQNPRTCSPLEKFISVTRAMGLDSCPFQAAPTHSLGSGGTVGCQSS